MSSSQRLLERLEHRLWLQNPAGRVSRALLQTLRTAVLIGHDIADGQLNLRAMSLVYTTLLSLVPLLAFSFSVLKGFGVHSELEPLLLGYLAPLGDDKAGEIARNIVGFVDKMSVGVLGSLGLALLTYTVVALMQKIESAFNQVWQVRQQRSFSQRFATFVPALTIGPLLMFSAVAITGSLVNDSLVTRIRGIPGTGIALELLAMLLPYVLVSAAFTFLYMFVPNTRVRLRAALTGGVVAGVIWETTGFAFASFASEASGYQAIYSTFASAILFMIWIYLSWLILLIGASIAFYCQHPEIVATGRRQLLLSHAQLEQCALALLAAIGSRFYSGGGPSPVDHLAATVPFSRQAVQSALGVLEAIDVIRRSDGQEPAYLPALPFECTALAELVIRLREYRPERPLHGRTTQPPSPLEQIDQRIRTSIRREFGDISLRDLASMCDPATPDSGTGVDPAIAPAVRSRG